MWQWQVHSFFFFSPHLSLSSALWKMLLTVWKHLGCLKGVVGVVVGGGGRLDGELGWL